MRYSAESLRAFVRECAANLGLPESGAAVFADNLVAADLRGIDSHGVARLAIYLDQIKLGNMDPKAVPTIANEAPATALVDGHHGVGQVVSDFAMSLAIEKARVNGIGWVTAIRSNHFGIAGYWAARAYEHGMIGLVSTNSGPFTAPTFGKERMFGTNPIAIAAPAGSEEDFMLDMATSAVAFGKVQIAAWEGKAMPKGWSLSPEGDYTTDPAVASEGALLPLGSFPELASYKGYGLAMALEILGAVLGGSMLDHEGQAMNRGGRMETSHFFAAIDVKRFVPLEHFKGRMDDLIGAVHNSALAPGAERIYIPGEKELIAERDRSTNGIPLHPTIEGRLKDVSEKIGVPFPEPLSD
jgi:LDH2 family malate/lactate/ureidoglycolate dehydrogenase